MAEQVDAHWSAGNCVQLRQNLSDSSSDSASCSDNAIDDTAAADGIISDDGDEEEILNRDFKWETITQDIQKWSVVILDPEMVQKTWQCMFWVVFDKEIIKQIATETNWYAEKYKDAQDN